MTTKLTITHNTLTNTLTSTDWDDYQQSINGIKYHKSIRRGLLIKKGKTDINDWIKRDLINQQIQSINHTIYGLMTNIDSILDKYPSLK
jgi:hypothetical protein